MTLAETLQRFMDHCGERLPVIDNLASPVLLGVVNKSTLRASRSACKKRIAQVTSRTTHSPIIGCTFPTLILCPIGFLP
jgi:hypothetical protein